MAYPIEVKLASKNAYFTPAESNEYYATPYARDGITVHWWGGGEQADQHDNIVNYFLQQAQAGTKSVNYVVSDGKITMMVNPDNVAWCSQTGNPTTISIEFQPTLSDEGYKRGGWLIDLLEKQYGHPLTLYPHSHWFATTCPGTISLDWLRAEANNVKGGNDVIPDRAHLDAIFQQFFGRNAIQAEIDEWVGKKTYTQLIDVLQAQAAYKAMVHQQTVGGIAVRDNWEKQINDLTKQVDALSKGVKTLASGTYQVR